MRSSRLMLGVSISLIVFLSACISQNGWFSAIPEVFAVGEISTSGFEIGKALPEHVGWFIVVGLGAIFAVVISVEIDRKSTRLNSSHLVISYAVFCLKKKTRQERKH